jgi:hypothetical protein
MSVRGVRMMVAMFVAIGLAGASSAVVAASGGVPSLIGEWHMDTMASGQTPSSVDGAHGLTIAGAQPVAGRFGQAFSFNGAARNYLRTAGADFQPAQITVMAWVKASSSPGSYKAIVSKGGNTDCGVASYALYTGASGGISFYIATSRTTTVNSASLAPANIWDGQWHAVVGTYDGSAVRLYVDGNLVGSPMPSSGASIDYAVDDSDLSIGDFEPCSGFSFTGDVDEARVYNGALSSAQVAELSSSTATTPPELPTTTTTTTTTTTPSTTPPSTTTVTPPPSAALTTVASTIKGASPILSAVGTTNATQLSYSINGSSTAAISVPASLPYTQLILPRGGSTTVKLNAVGSNQQQISTASTTLQVRSFGLPARVASALPQITVSSSSLATFRSVPLGTLIKALACAPTEVDWGVIGANGCFVHVSDPSQVPASEANLADQYYNDWRWPPDYGGCPGCAADPYPLPDADWSAYIASTTVKLNGMTLTPNGGASIVIDPIANHVFSSNATLKLGPFVIQQGHVDLDFNDYAIGAHHDYNSLTYTGQTTPVLSFDASKDVPVIGGFPLDGGAATAQLAFASNNGVRESVATLHVLLPPTFDVFGSGDQPSGSVSVSATNTSGFSLNTLDLSVPNASIGEIGLTDLKFHYDVNGDSEPGVSCPAKYWSASANIYLGSGDDGSAGPAILMSPPPFQGIRFCDGSFQYAGATVNFGASAPELFPGVFLNSINFQLGLNPTVIIGGATLSAAQITQVQGALLAVFASQGQPYTLTAAAAGPALQDLVGRTFTSTSFAIGGAVGINVPGVGVLNIAHGGIVYEYPDYIALGASVDTTLGIFQFKGNLGGQFVLGHGLFELDASAHINVTGFPGVSGGGLIVASEKGVVACVNVGPLNPGVGVMTDGHVDVWLPDGCKPSHYWSDARNYSHNLGHAAGAAVTFTVAKGETSKSVKLVGTDGAPHVTITGPGGQQLEVPADGAFSAGGGALEAISSSTYDTTWLGFKNAKPGTYTVTLLPGSAAIQSTAQTRPGYDTDFTAKVTGAGSKLTLHYDARKRGGGQRVTFYEQGTNITHPLVTSAGGRGTVRFTPAPGAGGIRDIVAKATVDGTPIATQTLAHFRFRGTPKTGKPRMVAVKREKGSLLIDWSAAAGATRYGVLIAGSDGSQRRYTVAGSRRSLKVSYPLTAGGRVSVSGRGALGDWGPARKSKAFKAAKAARSILLTKKHASAKKTKKKRK